MSLWVLLAGGTWINCIASPTKSWTVYHVLVLWMLYLLVSKEEIISVPTHIPVFFTVVMFFCTYLFLDKRIESHQGSLSGNMALVHIYGHGESTAIFSSEQQLEGKGFLLCRRKNTSLVSSASLMSCYWKIWQEYTNAEKWRRNSCREKSV